MSSAVEKALRWNLGAVFFTYLVFFGILGFFIGYWDFDHLSGYYEIAWRHWRHAPGLPNFNPYLCGGRTLGADPQIPVFSPIVLAVGLIGPTWAMKLEILFQVLLGSWGFWKLLEKLGVEKMGRLWGLFVYISGGAVVAKAMVGHVTLGFFVLMPLFLYLSYRLEETRGKETLRLLAGYALLFGYCGAYKPNFIIYAVLIMGVEAGLRSIFKRSPRPLVFFTLGAFLGFLVAAPTYLPAFFYFKEIPRQGYPVVLVPLKTLLANLVLPLKSVPKIFFGGSLSARHETNAYVGCVTLFFAGLALYRMPKKTRPELWSLAIVGVFFAWVGCGWNDADPYSKFMPGHYLRSLWPGFSTIRIPERFWYAPYLAIVTLSAVGWKTPRSRIGLWVVLLLGILPTTLGAISNLVKVMGTTKVTQWTPENKYSDDFTMTLGGPDDTYGPVRSGVGVIQCLYNVETYTFAEIKPGRMLEVKAPPRVQVNARWRGWSTIEIQMDNPYPVKASFNLNHSPFWRWQGDPSTARIVSAFKEPLTIESSETMVKGRLEFRQPWVKESAFACFLGLFLIAGLFLWGRNRP